MKLETAYPMPKPHQKLPVKDTIMLIACNSEGQVLLERRPPTGIWGGLWSLPEVDRPDQITEWCRHATGGNAQAQESWPVVRHTFSHFHLDITPVFVQVSNKQTPVFERDRVIWYKLHKPDSRGLPAPVQRMLQRLQERIT